MMENTQIIQLMKTKKFTFRLRGLIIIGVMTFILPMLRKC